MRKLLTVVISAAVMISALTFSAKADGVVCSAEAYVLMLADSGEVILCDNAAERLPMASTTKVMTALITLEEAAKDNRAVTFTGDMTAEGSSMYLNIGETVTLYDLAVGMLMQSGNDAANAAAIAIAGSVEDFAVLMNKRAGEIGMKNSRFVTPSGLDDEAHYSTAYDMALLLRTAMDNPDFADITSKKSMEVHFIDPPDKQVTYPNHNKLLSLYDGCIGGKTGYTSRAGRCLVSCAERGGLRLIAVTLDDGDDWNDHMLLFDYGFERYTVIDDEIPQLTVDVAGGLSEKVTLGAHEYNKPVIEREKAADLRREIIVPAFLYAPVKESEPAGKIVYYCGNTAIAEIPLYPDENIDYDDRPRGFLDYIKDVLHWH